jgi:hypothetical protein
VGDHVLLKVKARRSSLKLGNCFELAAHYYGAFEIMERFGPIAYMLAFPGSLCIHNVFHLYLLKKCVLDANHLIDWNVIQVEQEGDFSSATDLHIGSKNKKTLKLSHGDSKGPIDLVQS